VTAITSPIRPESNAQAELASRPIRSIADLLRTRAEQTPDTAAVLAPGRRPLTYAALWAQAQAVVQRLRAAGIGVQDRVALIAPNGPEMAVAFLSVTAGAVCAPLNPAYRAYEFKFYLTDLRAKALLVQRGMDVAAIDVARSLGLPVIELVPRLDEAAGLFDVDAPNVEAVSQTEYGQPDDLALLLHTSGTTARPKVVALTQRTLCASADTLAAAMDLTPTDRCLNVMPLFHVHGLQGATLTTLMTGGSVVYAPGFDHARFFHWLDEFKPTIYTAVPAVHQAVVEHAAEYPDIVAHSSLRMIRSGAAALPTQMMLDLQRTFNIFTFETYAMTEALPIATTPLPPRERKAGSVGTAAGVDIGILDGTGQLLPTGEVGEIVVRGEGVINSYENNPDANEAAFIDGWFRTGDLGYLDGDGYLFITGRLKEMINRGGEKVAPLEVEEVLLAHPSVAQAAVFAVPHAQLGENVAAAVVLRAGKVSERDLREFAAQKLADFKVPAQIVFVDDIPKGPTGKVQRLRLAEQLGLVDARSRTGGFTAPRTLTEETLAGVWRELLGVEQVGIYDDFFELGGHSLLAVRLLARIEKVFGRVVPLAMLMNGATVEGLAELLEQETWAAPLSSLVQIQAGDSRPPLFCIHAKTGNVVIYKELARYLGQDQPVYGLQARGVDGRQEPLTRVEEMAAYYLEEIVAVQPEGPYLLFGYSFGGLVAYEMARQLNEQGRQVALLALGDTFWRRTHKQEPKGSRSSKGKRRVKDVKVALLNILTLPSEYRRAYLRQRADVLGRKLRGSYTAPVNPWLHVLEGMPPAIKNVMAACQEAADAYVPEGRIDHLTYFRASDNIIDAKVLSTLNRLASAYDIHEVPGNHNSMIHEPNIQHFTSALRACLDRVYVQGG
jgi:oxalate---CoA ligase